MLKLLFTRCIERDFIDLAWSGQILNQCEVYCHSAYWTGIDISHFDSLNWILDTILDYYISDVQSLVVRYSSPSAPNNNDFLFSIVLTMDKESLDHLA